MYIDDPTDFLKQQIDPLLKVIECPFCKQKTLKLANCSRFEWKDNQWVAVLEAVQVYCTRCQCAYPLKTTKELQDEGIATLMPLTLHEMDLEKAVQKLEKRVLNEATLV